MAAEQLGESWKGVKGQEDLLLYLVGMIKKRNLEDTEKGAMD